MALLLMASPHRATRTRAVSRACAWQFQHSAPPLEDDTFWSTADGGVQQGRGRGPTRVLQTR
jgi:hypothetical protein